MFVMLIALLVIVGIAAPITMLLFVFKESFAADALAAARALLGGK